MSRSHTTVILTLLAFVFFLSDCSKKEQDEGVIREEVLSTHPDGARKVTALMKKEGPGTVKLRSYEFYETGEKKKEFNHKDNLYFGEWTFWYKDGAVLAMGSFDEKTIDPNFGIGSGQYYWPDGTVMIRIARDEKNARAMVTAVYDEAGKRYDPDKQPEELKERIRTVLEMWHSGKL